MLTSQARILEETGGGRDLALERKRRVVEVKGVPAANERIETRAETKIAIVRRREEGPLPG